MPGLGGVKSYNFKPPLFIRKLNQKGQTEINLMEKINQVWESGVP